MNLADRVKDTSPTTGTGAFAVSGSAPPGYQMLSALGGVGATFGYVIDGGAEWEVGIGTITAANTFSRAPSASSNSGAAVNFSVGTKTVFHSVTAAQHAKYQSTNTAAFATAIPLTSLGATYMPQQTVSAVLAFTVGASPMQGALVYLRLVADGTNAPTFTGFKEWGGSLGYDNRAGIVNEVQFFYDGYDYWYSISQAVGAVAVDTIAPTSSSAAVANATPTVANITMSEAMDPAYVPAASAFTVSGHTVSSVAISGSTINLTCSAAFVNGEAARTAAYTQPGTNNARDLAGNLLVNFSGLAITNNVVAAASAVTMTGPTGGVNGVASTNFTLGVSPVGGTITGTVVVTPSDGGAGGTFTPTTKSLTSGAPTGTFTYTPASTGAKTISVTNNGGLTNPANITYTVTAAATAPATMAAPVATAGDTTASVVLVAPSDGGSAITGYTVTSSPAGGTDTNAATTGLTHSITGLTNGTAYTFTATATNAVGTSAASPASNSVTPVASGASLRLSQLTHVTESGTGPYTYTADTTTYAAGIAGPGGVATTHFASGVDGWVSMAIGARVGASNSGSDPILGITPNTSITTYDTMAYGIFSDGGTALYKAITSGAIGTVNGTATAPQTGDIIRATRTGSTLVFQVARTGTPTAFITLHTFSGVSTGILYINMFAANQLAISNLSGSGLV